MTDPPSLPASRASKAAAAGGKRAAKPTDHPAEDDASPPAPVAARGGRKLRKTTATTAATDEIADDTRKAGATGPPVARRPHIKISLSRKAAALDGSGAAVHSDNDGGRPADDACDLENELCE